ncbi:hypothetical protein [Mitsuokella multacida]|uniref:hypothetical protein n=1 Tax=Mitsuokella multacida TaxID=52226 RepID=UPI0026DCD909|nr:hypothetical protein [Mitsuokella multacida]
MSKMIEFILEKIFSLGTRKNIFSILAGFIVIFYCVRERILDSLFLLALLFAIVYLLCILILLLIESCMVSCKHLLEKTTETKTEELNRMICFLQNLSSYEEKRLEQFIKNKNRPEPFFLGFQSVAMGGSIPEDFFEIVDLPQEVKEPINGGGVISTKQGKRLKPDDYERFSQVWPIWEKIKSERRFHS